MKITVDLLDKIIKTAFFCAVIGIVASPMIPWLMEPTHYSEDESYVSEFEIRVDIADEYEGLFKNIQYTQIAL